MQPTPGAPRGCSMLQALQYVSDAHQQHICTQVSMATSWPLTAACGQPRLGVSSQGPSTPAMSRCVRSSLAADLALALAPHSLSVPESLAPALACAGSRLLPLPPSALWSKLAADSSRAPYLWLSSAPDLAQDSASDSLLVRESPELALVCPGLALAPLPPRAPWSRLAAGSARAPDLALAQAQASDSLLVRESPEVALVCPGSALAPLPPRAPWSGLAAESARAPDLWSSSAPDLAQAQAPASDSLLVPESPELALAPRSPAPAPA